MNNRPKKRRRSRPMTATPDSLATCQILFNRDSVTIVCILMMAVSASVAPAQAPPGQPGSGVTIQLPVVGVSIDADGLLTTRAFADPTGQLKAVRRQARWQKHQASIQQSSDLRKVSLRRLEQALAKELDSGRQLSDQMKYLAGLTRIEYAFIDPDHNDIILAGPAEGWMDDLAGRIVGIETGTPTLLLEDLLTALRAFAPGQNLGRWVGCSIDPTPQGIQQLKQFQSTIPARIRDSQRAEVTRRVAQGLQDSLGLAQIRVYGIPRKTHLAQVMVEADYRMKLIAVGREPQPISDLVTFIEALKGAPRNMQRWWFTPNYQCVRQAPDGLAMQMVGQGVQLGTENIDYTDQAQIVRTNVKPSAAARAYSSSFTKHYERIAQVSPVFGQLRDVIDLLIAGAWILKNNAYDRAGWQPSLLLDESRLPAQVMADPRTAQSVSNAVWKGNVLILPAGGGVSIAATNALSEQNLMIGGDKAQWRARELKMPANGDRWWWD